MANARVTNVDALTDFRAALATFAVEIRQALADLDMESRRALQWITGDRPAHWRAEGRRSSDAVGRAKDELAQSRTFKKVGDTPPSCIEEKKALEMAKRRLEHAEQKIEAVKQWGRAAVRAVDEFKGPIQQLVAVLESDIPHALAVLEKMSEALANYSATSAPVAVPWEELVGEGAKPSMAQPDDIPKSLAAADTSSLEPGAADPAESNQPAAS